MTNPLLKLTPLGGLGQIGSNMTLIQFREHTFLIDAGILFPNEDVFEINYLIPNLDDILNIDYLLITHGHEDHIGAIYNIILKYPHVKIFAPRFAAGLIRKKLDYNKAPFPITVINPSETLSFSGLDIDYIQVNHSIPDTFGLYFSINEKNLGLFFISDFKIDLKTKNEPPFDFLKLKNISQKHHKKILLADSTNITSKNLSTPSEEDLLFNLESIISKAKGRIFVTLFSSNIYRIQNIIELAIKYQYHIVPYGRSMISYLKTATEENVILNYDIHIRSSDSIKADTENILVFLSGCQGDFLGTFRRVSLGEDSVFKPRPTDTFILSSKAIPGNEKKITQIINKLAAANVELHTGDEQLLHVSGHPGKDDLGILYKEFSPTDAIPIHGELIFLREHIKYIKSAFPQIYPHFMLNHHELTIDDNLNLSIVEKEVRDPVIYHGNNLIIEREHISERRKLAGSGALFLSIKLNSKATYDCHGYQHTGLPNFFTDHIDHFNLFLKNEIDLTDFKNLEKSKEDIRISIRRYFNARLGYKPIIMVNIL